MDTDFFGTALEPNDTGFATGKRVPGNPPNDNLVYLVCCEMNMLSGPVKMIDLAMWKGDSIISSTGATVDRVIWHARISLPTGE